MSELESLCEQVGEEAIAALVAAFYRRVPADPVLAPMYPADDLAGAEARLRDFLVFRLGGPQRYVEQRGHPRLRMRHMPFAITPAARDRWMEHMTAALDEVAWPAASRALMEGFLGDVASFLINRPQG